MSHTSPPPTSHRPPQLDVESVEDDHTEIIDMESYIQNALSMLKHRSVT